MNLFGVYLKNNRFRHTFEYWYLVLMVIYMAQMTDDTSRMVGSIGGNPIPLLLPIVATIVLVVRNKVHFSSRNLRRLVGIFTLWSLCVLVKLDLYFSTKELSYYFFLFYAIVIAYIHNRVFGYRILLYYEDILVFFAKISCILWCFSNALPGVSSSFFSLFEPTGFGRNFIYIYNWMDPNLGQEISGFLRNAGCSWEPGRFAIMLCLAIVSNFSVNGLKIYKNNNLFWLLAALVLTFSTTGYSIFFLILFVFLAKKLTVKKFILSLFFLIPSVYFAIGLDFMGEKIKKQSDVEDYTSTLLNDYEWIEANMGKSQGQEYGYVHAIDRLPSIYLEWQNVRHDLLLGYGLNPAHSYLVTKISSLIYLCGGFAQIFGMYGIFLGLYIYIVLFKSSIEISKRLPFGNKWAIFICFLLSAISYPLWGVPIFTSVWLFSLFVKS